MENKESFDLNRAIAGWREGLLKNPDLIAEEARELETHLVASCEELRRLGIRAEEAFWLARRRLGCPDELATEFAKLDPGRPWRERLTWLAGGIMGGYVCTTGLSLYSTLLTNKLPELGIEASGPGGWAIYVAGFLLMIGSVLTAAATFARAPRLRSPFRLAGGWGAPLGLALILVVLAICVGISFLDSRMIKSSSGDMIGTMLAAGCAIERVMSSLTNALFVSAVTIGIAGIKWSLSRGNRRKPAAPCNPSR